MPHREWKVLGDFLPTNGVAADVMARARLEARERQDQEHKDGGIHVPIGQILRREHRLSSDDLETAVRKLEEYRLEYLDPITQFSPSTVFGRRLFEQVIEKKRVAAYAAGRFVRPESCVFIADGTSGFYSFLAIAQDIAPKSEDPPQIKTNSLAIALEYSQSLTIAGRLLLEIVGRQPLAMKQRNEYLALGGDDKQLREACKGITAILPVTAISFDEGPCARGDRIRRIKLAIMESAARIVFLADHSKMNKTAEQRTKAKQYPVYENPGDWQKWRNERKWHLVTSIDPRIKVVGAAPGGALVTLHREKREYDDKKDELRQYELEAAKFAQENKKEDARFSELIRPAPQ